MNYGLADEVALITGAASGLGLAAQAFAAERASTAEGTALPMPQGR
jgi:NAD(P)-dependent dehydrogenase (short-subunit alcohol dehydrogenase family)